MLILIKKQEFKKITLFKLSCVVCMVFVISGCTFEKDILLFQNFYKKSQIKYPSNSIQPNDILSIAISALVPKTAVAYNIQAAKEGSTQPVSNLEVLRLQGYLVKNDGTINLPILGEISTKHKTIAQLERYIYKILEEGDHLVKPSVNIRLLNSKVTVLGEVKSPGTYTFTEQAISVPQAIGYAKGLTINGKRKNIMLIRELDGVRKIYRIDLTTTNWMNKEQYYVKQNDIIIVSPNQAKVKSAGYLGNVSSLIGVISLLVTTTVLLTD